MNKHINIKQSQSLSDLVEPVCILCDKVYSFCQQRDCFPRFSLNIKDIGEQFKFIGINFQEGYISEGTLNVTPMGDRRPNFSRVKFTFKIPFTVTLKNIISSETISINGLLPEISKDIILFMPEARNEFDFRIVVETRSEVLVPPEIIDNKIEIPIGVFSIIRVVGRVQLSISAYDFNPEPPEGETFEETEKIIYQEFDNRSFPDDFFPPKFEDLDIGI
ncbi:hypothetical protein IZY60_14865 [Lutibacter sp. B2]|nr:hypothetical protein [Lutibacter sp. B2]